MISVIDFNPGDIVKVHQKVQDGDKTRIQVFQGTVLAIQGRGMNKTFRVQKIVGGIGVEKIWPVFSPNIDRVDVKEHPKRRVRRAKLNFLRVPKS